MPYVLYQFGDLVLPAYNADNDVSTGQVAPVFLELPGGGVFDVLGTDPAKRRITPLNKLCTLDADDTTALRTAYNALRAKIGRRDRLWRRWDEGYYDWCWARLTNIAARRTTKNYLHLEVDLQFVMISPHWYGQHHGGTWTLDDGILFDTGYPLDTTDWLPLTAGAATSLTITNSGNRTVTNAVVTVAAGSANITATKIGIAGISEMSYTGTINAGTGLVVDCGALSVTNNGNEAYVYFALTANHKRDDWLRLEPGDNTVVVTITGGGTGAQALIEFFDGWE
jgi:hypothetical protein